jgi:hypothetical protein
MPQATSPKTDPALARLGFKNPNPRIKPRVIMGIDGKPKSGKSRFALTAPGPIAYINFDRGLEHLLAQMGRSDVMLKDYTRMMPLDGAWNQNKAKAVWKDYSDTFVKALQTRVRTLVVDTASDVWEMIRWAAFGKLDHVKPHHYTQVNGPYRRLLNECQHHDVNVILLHKAKELWEETPNGPKPTGQWVRDGFRGTSFAMEFDGFLYRDEDGDREFHMEVLSCGPEAALVGQTFDGGDITFADVASMVLPGVNPKEWR